MDGGGEGFGDEAALVDEVEELGGFGDGETIRFDDSVSDLMRDSEAGGACR